VPTKLPDVTAKVNVGITVLVLTYTLSAVTVTGLAAMVLPEIAAVVDASL
jgi:hypothetical protein